MTAKKNNSVADEPQSISPEQALEYKVKAEALENEIQEYIQICKDKDERMVELQDRIKELEEDKADVKATGTEFAELLTQINEKEDENEELKQKVEALTEKLEQTQASAKAEGPTFEIEKKGKDGTVNILTIEVTVAKLNIKSMGLITAEQFVASAGKGVNAAREALDLMLKNGSSALNVISRRKKTAKKGGN